ncbi:tetratricopeptide repeat protein [Desulfovibrio ferrophilus]|uniref:Uncharacterized protein n=1 Tax=Desulfovibrio ferrophilus TaxID=241368 RepID=A0A2Z6AUR5_9BACT|nr:tetratricopeptide repeat protein [Desulfovibrio ferrophilus]BBD06973.1 uncharacterized protein DFE_0247 [Desulfovibrio ferrophilus]
MYKLSSLLKDLPTLHESRMSSSGFAVWIVWADELTDAIPSTFRDFGGMEISSENQHSLWFFFTKDVFHAMARLQVWANLNDLPVYIQILPANLGIGFQLEMALSISSELYSQQSNLPDEFEVWVHPKVRQEADGIPGITLEKIDKLYSGIAAASWTKLFGDPRMGFASTLGWFFILKPLGNPMDKAFIEGWRNFFLEIEKILKRLKLKYIVSEGYLTFELDSYKNLDRWCREILTMIRGTKDCEECNYWPSVMLAVEKAGYQFNDELPNKIPIEWDQMAPDFPHMSYRTAFLLGDNYKIKDVSYSFERSRMTDWCYVHMSDLDSIFEEQGSLNITLPVGLLAGKERPCFYCGLRSHTETECPTRTLQDLDNKVWKDISMMGLDSINMNLKELGEAVKDEPVSGMERLLGGAESAGTMLRALFEINAPVQLRYMPMIWRSLGKDLPAGLYKLAPLEKSSLTKAYDMFLAGEAAEAEHEAKEGALRNPRDFQYRTLLGFLLMERGDLDRAIGYWKEAEPLGDSPIHFAYHKYLQARGLEVQGRFDGAMNLYKEAYALCPKWDEPHYRQAVCMVKMGFSEHAVGLIDQLLDDDANLFNRIIIDPEAERGVVQILANLHGRWVAAQEGAKDGEQKLRSLIEEVEDWFGKDHEYSMKMKRQIGNILQLAEIENYVVFNKLISGKLNVSRSLKSNVDKEVKVLQKQAEQFRKRLKGIHEEISWFPFPRALREFNRDFNFCVTKLNWVKQQHFKVAKNFRMSHEFFKQVDENLKRLSSRLVTLRIVRDATLFALLMGKSFMWMEIVGLGLALVAMPVAVVVGENFHYAWLTEFIEGQRWGIQKGLIIVVSVLAFTVSLLKTALVFEKRKAKFFDEQKELAKKHMARQAKTRQAKTRRR